MRLVFLIPIICLLLLGACPVSGLVPLQQKIAVTQVAPVSHITLGQGVVVSVVPTHTTLSMGSLTFESNPPGAEIWVNGEDQLKITPWSSPAYPSSPQIPSYFVSLKYPGYEVYSETITLQSGESYTVSAELVPLTTTQSPSANPPSDNPPEYQQGITQQIPAQTSSTGSPQPSPSSQSPIPGTGSLSVITNPTGATIEVDGIPAGASPATIPGLSAGTHNLTVMKPGYAVLITQVNIVGGQTVEYSTTLLPATEPTKRQSPGFDALVAGLAVACIVVLKRPA
jgi:hypothetical protein